jgi:hypothetical protein
MSRMLLQVLLLVVVWMALIIGYAIVAAGPGSPLMHYCLGLATFLPLSGIAQAYDALRRWRVIQLVIDWQRVERMVATASDAADRAADRDPR